MKPIHWQTLNRRLDAAFDAMEIAWALYQQKRDEARLARYVASRRRCNQLWSLIRGNGVAA